MRTTWDEARAEDMRHDKETRFICFGAIKLYSLQRGDERENREGIQLLAMVYSHDFSGSSCSELRRKYFLLYSLDMSRIDQAKNEQQFLRKDYDK